MRSFIRILLFSAIPISAYTQTSTVLTQRCLGDSSNTTLYCITKTNDGGYITGGWVTANNGDVSGYKGGAKDGWIVKLNSLGGIEWQRCFGGSGTDIVYDIIQAPDGGYIITGSSDSYDGDITSTHSVAGNVADDAFLAKLSASGQIQWVRCYGGSDNDIFKKILSTPDGGFMCVGSSESNDGDVSGHHPSSPYQQFNITTDVWVAKINSTGIIDWQKSIGGGFLDQADDIVATPDSNYIIAGGGIGYQTTDVDAYYGGGDVWLIKISPGGAIIWGKAYGGSDDEHNATIVPATDGGFVVAFLTYSNDGICSQNHSAGPSMSDIAMIKIADDGSLVWSKCYGGSSYEWFGNLGYNDDRRGGLLATADGGYILCGSTESIDGDASGLHGKTRLTNVYNSPLTYTTGEDDIWVVKVNQQGSLQWQTCLGGTNIDWGQSIASGSDITQFVVSGYVISNDGDISGNKLAPGGNGTEGWIAKIKAGNTITGLVFKDNNSNGVQDADEPLVTGAMVKSSNSSYSFSSVTNNGSFINLMDTGQFVTTVTYSPYFIVLPSSIRTPYHSTYYNSDTINFALQPIPGNTDLVVNAFTPSFIRLGKDMQYKVMVRNVGTINIPSGTLKFVKDHRLTYQSATPNVSSVTADTLTWNYNNLNAGDTLSLLITMTVQVPPIANLNDTLTNMISVAPVNNDVTPANDTAITKDVIIGAFDPNDKTEIHGGVVTSDFASSGQYLQYTIRFQNTGNDTAFNVIVKDTLDGELDWSTVQMISSSHPVSFTITNGNQLTWTFSNINLVDSNTNEPLSHGYVVYQVKPKSNVVVNDIIHNDASIYFDYNLPVATNDATTIVQNSFIILPTQLVKFSGNKQGSKVTLLWRISEADFVNSFEIERSFDGRNFSMIGNKGSSLSLDYSFNDDISDLQQKLIYYRLKILDKDGSFIYSSVLLIRNNSTLDVLTVYPNPAHQNAFLSYRSTSDGNILIYVIDASGKTVIFRKETIKKGETIIEINGFSSLSSGNYLIRVQQSGSSLQSNWVLKE